MRTQHCNNTVLQEYTGQSGSAEEEEQLTPSAVTLEQRAFRPGEIWGLTTHGKMTTPGEPVCQLWKMQVIPLNT